MILYYFFMWRILLFIVSYCAPFFVPYLGFFPYKELLVEFGLPSWISSFANFDGIHYLLIARQGYSQWEQAFFPLFPLLIKTISFLVPNVLIASLLLSNVCFAVGLFFFNKLLKMWRVTTSWPLLLLLSFPTAFYFGVVYTEGLFFMLFVLSLYNLEKKYYWYAALFATLSSATRLIGIFLIIPFFLHFYSLYRGKWKDFRLSTFDFMTFISPLLGLLSYMFYLWQTTRDPLFFFNSQPVFGANRSTHLILLPQVYFRYLKILFTATHDFQWALSLFEMSIFTMVFAVLCLDLIRLLPSLQVERSVSEKSHLRSLDSKKMGKVSLSLFSFINLILPTLTGTFSSIPRYALFSLSFFIFLGEIKSWKVKIGIFGVFVLLQIVLLSLFVQGYFVG